MIKKLAIALALTAMTTGVFAQGKVTLLNTLTGTVRAPVYMPELSDASVRLIGNTSAGTPAGTTTYTGGLVTGTGYTAELWSGASGISDPLSAGLTSTGGRTAFRTGTAAGYITQTDITLASAPANTVVSLQLRVWDNVGGTVTTWANAVSANVTRGYSEVFQSNPLAGANPGDPIASNTTGLRSFNLQAVPEPSTIALMALGAGALALIRRRK